MESTDDNMYMLFLVVYWSCVAWGLWFLGRGIWHRLKKFKNQKTTPESVSAKDEAAK